MRVFVAEYVCGGALGGCSLPASLRVEGWAMLTSIVADLERVHGLEVWTTLDRRFATEPFPPCRKEIAGPREEQRLFDRLAAGSAATLVIAPELDGILLERCRRVESVGGRLLGPSSEAVRLTADKLALSAYLTERGIPTIPTRLSTWNDLGLSPGGAEENSPRPEPWVGMSKSDGSPGGAKEVTTSFAPPGLQPEPLVHPAHTGIWSYPLVIKPRDGAGSQRTFVVSSDAELHRLGDLAQVEHWPGEPILQPYYPGVSASVGFLRGPKTVVPLLPSRQTISADGRLRYLGGSLPLDEPFAEQTVALGRRAVESIPALMGYVGVDLICTPSGTTAIVEINPRLTTSYIGYRAASAGNLAEMMLRILREEPISPPRWREGRGDFTPDGRVSWRTSTPEVKR